ncbi:MAG: HU family DNA-binding protein [Candidatus Ancillula sp.]|jgi:DNA-binding protein HU-beta|nr:HU family DNA-binding protein [Candidatus Ancillula sp.]
MALTKADIVAAVADNAGITKADAERAVNAFTEVFISEVKKSGEFGITGLFKAEVKNTAAREGRNPATGATIKIPAGKTVRIKAGSVLKNSVK